MDPLQRRFLACLTGLALLAVVAQGISGIAELCLYLAPLFVIVALLLSGRYVAAEQIARRWRRGDRAPRRRRVRGRWPAVAVIVPRSRLERDPNPQRGPPAFAGA
jgi:hypothetical protein